MPSNGTERPLVTGKRGRASSPGVSLLAVARRLLSLSRSYWLPLVGGAVLMLLSTGISLLLPLLARDALDTVVRVRKIATMDRLAAELLALYLLSSGLGFAQQVLLGYTGTRIVLDLRQRLFAHLQRLPLAFFDRAKTGELMAYLTNNVGQLQQTLTGDSVAFLSQVVTLVGGIVLAVVLDVRLTLVVVGLLAVTVGTFTLFGKWLRQYSRNALDAFSVATGQMNETLSNIRLVKAFAREPYEDARAADKLANLLRINQRSLYYQAGLNTVVGIGFLGVRFGLLWYGGRSVLAGSLSPGSLLAFVMVVGTIQGPMSSLAGLYTRLQQAAGAADRLFELMDREPETPDLPEAEPFPEGPGEVTFDSMRFGYVPDVEVLADVTLTAPAGKATALVGASGAGKSTLVALLYRFYEAQSGAVLIDGVPLHRIRRDSLRKSIGLVPQEPTLFNGTIRENIRYGCLEATDEAVEAAARTANVQEFVESLPQGYDTPIGERGVTLSGGQKQRIAIARAVLKDPRILVLDEATSALDTRSEALVQEALNRLMRGRTTLVIAHRLSTIRAADRIVVMNEGRVAEQGTHPDLLARGGVYAALYRASEEARVS